MSKISDLQAIKAKGVKHIHNCKEEENDCVKCFGSFLMTFINATPGKDAKVEHLSLGLNSMLFELVNDPHILELCKSKYMVKRFIV